MNLLEQAEQDLSFTVEDKDNGFGISIIIVDKNGTRYGEDGSIVAKTQDIGFFIDPGSDVGVQDRTVWIDLRLSSLKTLGINIKTKDGWKVIYTDKQGDTWNFSIEIASPDRTLGIMKLHLKFLKTV